MSKVHDKSRSKTHGVQFFDYGTESISLLGLKIWELFSCELEDSAHCFQD